MLSISNRLIEVLVVIYVVVLVVLGVLVVNKPVVESTITEFLPEVYQPIRAIDTTVTGHLGISTEDDEDETN